VSQCLSEWFNLLFGNSFWLVFSHAPNWFHHSHKVFVWGNRHGKVRVVIKPFFMAYYSIRISFHSIKIVKEVWKNFLFGFWSVLKVLVCCDIKDLTNISGSELSRVIFIHQFEGFFNHVWSSFAQWFSQAADELLKRNVTILVNIVIFHESLHFNNFWEDAKCV